MIHNTTRLPHAAFQKLGPGGLVFEVFVLKATFVLDPSTQALKVAEVQVPVRLGDRHVGPDARHPAGQVLAEPGDAVLFKPGADIWVTGTACTRDRRPLERWVAGVGVGNVRHSVELSGPREWRRGVLGWGLSTPEPIAELSLDYRLALGGHWAATAGDDARTTEVRKPDNPAGCGWLPDAEALADLPVRMRSELRERLGMLQRMRAPQILLPAQPLHHPTQPLPTAGLGPIARWWAPRTDYLGTRDHVWRSTRFPHYPEDFDLRFFQAAVPPLRTPQPLQGDERIGLMGVLPEGDCGWRLPGLRPRLQARLDDDSLIEAPLRLDTVAVHLDQRQLCLCWRAVLPPAHAAREIEVRLDRAALQGLGLPS